MADQVTDTVATQKIEIPEEFKQEVNARIERVAKEAKEAADAAIAAVSSSAVRKEDLDRALDSQRRDIARTIAGESASEEDPLKDYILESPSQVLMEVKRRAKEEAVAEMRDLNAREAMSRDENLAAINTVLGERPDIEKSDLRIVKGFLDEQSEDLPAEERLRGAVKQFDLWCEQRGLGDSKERIAKASSTKSSVSAGEPQPKSHEDILREEVEETRRQEQAKRSWN